MKAAASVSNQRMSLFVVYVVSLGIHFCIALLSLLVSPWFVYGNNGSIMRVKLESTRFFRRAIAAAVLLGYYLPP